MPAVLLLLVSVEAAVPAVLPLRVSVEAAVPAVLPLLVSVEAAVPAVLLLLVSVEAAAPAVLQQILAASRAEALLSREFRISCRTSFLPLTVYRTWYKRIPGAAPPPVYCRISHKTYNQRRFPFHIYCIS